MILKNSIAGVLEMEIEAYHKVQLFSWIFFPIFIGFALLQLFFFFLYNGPLHPLAKILDGVDNTSKGNLILPRLRIKSKTSGGLF